MGIVLALGVTLVLFLPGVLSVPTIKVGDVASRTMQSPRDFTIVDSAATARLKQRAADRVGTQYQTVLGPQTASEAAATAMFNAALTLQGTAAGSGRSTGGNAATVSRLSGGAVSTATGRALLTFSPTALKQIRTLVLNALAAAKETPLDSAQAHNLRLAPPFPKTGVAKAVRTEAATLFGVFLKPNRKADAALTSAARASAEAQVTPVHTHYRDGQAIVRVGDVIRPDTLTALHASGLLDRNTSWQTLLGDFALAALTAALLHGYLIASRSSALSRPRRLFLLDSLFLGACLGSALLLQGRGSFPYVFPAAVLSILLTLLLDFPLSLVATTLWAFLAGWELDGSMLIATYYLLSGMTGAMMSRGTRRSGEFFVSGFMSAGAGLLCVFAGRLLAHGSDWLGMGSDVAAIALSGLLAATLTLGSLAALGRLFGVTTALHLLELSHPNHPLLRRLMNEAPGTFHHSMMIGTLAERAAEQIGADPLLVRVIAYFHDIGKLVHPLNFAENQATTPNIHDRIEPEESVALILEHVYEGVRLARAYHLPEVLEDGIWQHHGTNLVSFFYQQAVDRRGADQVRIEDFRYPGPRPQSREMAILMLADGVEAAVRATPGADAEQIRLIIHRLAQERLHDGQLDECDLTLRDLTLIESSFAIVLQGLSHTRVRYPRAPLPAVGVQ
jgi:putative nucleotidyltransferase with HDIG domain